MPTSSAATVDRLNAAVDSPQSAPRAGLAATLLRGGGSALILKVAGTAANFAATVWLARWLGEVGYGDYVYTQNWVTFLVLFATFGLDTAAVRYIASYQAQGEWGLLRGFMRRCRQWTALGAAALAVVMGGALWVLASRLRPDLLHTMAIGCLLLMLLSPLQVACSQLRGLKHVLASQLPLLLLRPLLIAIAVGVAYLLTDSRGSASLALGINTAITLCLLLLTVWMVRSASPTEMAGAQSEYTDTPWRRTALGLLITTSLITALSRIDVLMLGSLKGTAQAGIYETAANITLLVFLGLNSIEVIAAPLFAELHSLKRSEELQRIAWLTACGAFAAALPVALTVLFAGSWLLGLYGAPFQQGYWPMVILTGAALLNISSGSTGVLLIMTGHQRNASIIMGGTAVLNIVLNSALIPQWGMVGAASASAISTVVWNGSMLIYIWRRLGINSSVLPIRVAAQ